MPVIGIVPLVDIQRNSLWMIPGYMDGLREAGALPIMLPLTDDPKEISQICGMCDGILFTGGQDVEPAVYGEPKKDFCGETCVERDRMEYLILEQAISRNMPFLGICRGIQFINAALGGTLYQDLPTERPGGTDHHMSPPYDRQVHKVDIVPGSPLGTLLGHLRIGVNSYHHQAVKDLSPVLRCMAVSEDGLTEAVYHPGMDFGWAVQWHPELSYRTDRDSMEILRAFAEAARSFRGKRLNTRDPRRRSPSRHLPSRRKAPSPCRRPYNT
ncbi:MAG: gamma-glutamyl-gamma-aminobutyrate hydrolase family protein [archaeon]|nr:gamma-glutamyl-gamma-aminobutyrate hydrolase family protein [archaeon]